MKRRPRDETIGPHKVTRRASVQRATRNNTTVTCGLERERRRETEAGQEVPVGRSQRGMHYTQFRYFLPVQYLQTRFTPLCNLMIWVDVETGWGEAEDLNNSRSGIEPPREDQMQLSLV